MNNTQQTTTEVYISSEAGTKRCASEQQAKALAALYTQAGLTVTIIVDTVAVYTEQQHVDAIVAYNARVKANSAPCEMNARRAARLAAAAQ